MKSAPAAGRDEFLVELTKAVARFGPGPPTVGGATKVALITRHEGFSWVRDDAGPDHAKTRADVMAETTREEKWGARARVRAGLA